MKSKNELLGSFLIFIPIIYIMNSTQTIYVVHTSFLQSFIPWTQPPNFLNLFLFFSIIMINHFYNELNTNDMRRSYLFSSVIHTMNANLNSWIFLYYFYFWSPPYFYFFFFNPIYYLFYFYIIVLKIQLLFWVIVSLTHLLLFVSCTFNIFFFNHCIFIIL